MTALPHHFIMSVEEYLQLEVNSVERKYEYIDGVVTMLAGGTPNHSLIAANITGILYNLLRGSPCRVYSSDIIVRLSEKCYVHPDVTVSCDQRDQGRNDFIQYPSLVVEVLSPSTESRDRNEKFTSYRDNPTIQEYMMVNTDQKIVEIYRREKKKLWSYIIFQADDEVELTRLGIHFSVTDIYENILFPKGSEPVS